MYIVTIWHLISMLMFTKKYIRALLYYCVQCVQLYTREQRAVDLCFLMMELEVLRPKSTGTTTNTCQTMSVIDGSATPLLLFLFQMVLLPATWFNRDCFLFTDLWWTPNCPRIGLRENLLEWPLLQWYKIRRLPFNAPFSSTYWFRYQTRLHRFTSWNIQSYKKQPYIWIGFKTWWLSLSDLPRKTCDPATLRPGTTMAR